MGRIRHGRLAISLVSLYVAVLCGSFFNPSSLATTHHTTTEVQLLREESSSSSSLCGYRDYPSPDIDSGLPFLADVFASHDAQWVYFIVINRGHCDPQFKESDSFSAKDGIGHRFVCGFPDGDFVFTEFIKYNGPHDTANVIRCRIPDPLQHFVAKPQSSTKLHVNLHAIESSLADPTVGRGGVRPFPSMSIRDTPKLEQLPVCHGVEPFISTNNQTITYNMTAVTRIMAGPFKDGYNLYMDKTRSNTMSLDYEKILDEWVNHHVKIGINHFIFYVHDNKTPSNNGGSGSGPSPVLLKDLLQPMMDSGLVTYKYFPLDDCMRKEDNAYKGYRDCRGQAAATLSALHRYGHLTTYMAHMDVDEFFIPMEANLIETMNKYEEYDVVAFKPYLMVPCNGTNITANETSIVNKWRCWDGHYADQKLIFKPERIWQYRIHYPVSTPEGMEPLTKVLNGTRMEGLLAHYRRSNDKEWRTDQFSGMVQNHQTLRLDAIDEFEQNHHSY